MYRCICVYRYVYQTPKRIKLEGFKGLEMSPSLHPPLIPAAFYPPCTHPFPPRRGGPEARGRLGITPPFRPSNPPSRRRKQAPSARRRATPPGAKGGMGGGQRRVGEGWSFFRALIFGLVAKENVGAGVRAVRGNWDVRCFLAQGP